MHIGSPHRKRAHFQGVVFIFLALLCPVAQADEVDDFIKGVMERESIPGLSLAVLKRGEIIKCKGYGVADIELKSPATPDTVYQLASITKTFTATAIMQLVEDRKIRLSDRITRRLAGLPKTWSEVKISHLLTHTSGIKSYTQLSAIADHPEREFTADEMIALVADLPLEFRPGERYDYSNTGYYLLGLLIENISGQSYGDFLNTRIFTPAGMARTRVNSSDFIPGRATGYVLGDGKVKKGTFVNPTQPFAAGALITTVTDLAKWDAALYTDKILKQSTLQKMWKSATLNDGTVLNYGFGWGTREWQGRRYVQHNGGIIGFSSHMRRGLDDGLTIIVLANLSGRAIYAEEIAQGLLPFYRTETESK
ncbi:MAG TPA: serine hydrolase domain-containing protein [Verrucomicrobiae bacterium]|nr:serine hydrolase domain-containing protein [Verrucomicrobiae bacterium]